MTSLQISECRSGLIWNLVLWIKRRQAAKREGNSFSVEYCQLYINETRERIRKLNARKPDVFFGQRTEKISQVLSVRLIKEVAAVLVLVAVGVGCSGLDLEPEQQKTYRKVREEYQRTNHVEFHVPRKEAA